jgi:hypothetical protein
MKQELFLLLATVALACGQPTHSPNELLSLPDWLSNFPETKNVTTTASTMAIDVSYNVSGQLDAVVAHYQAELQAGGVKFTKNFDGIGSTISATSADKSCIVRIREGDMGARVRASCARKAEAAVSQGTMPVPEVFQPLVIAPEPQTQTVRTAHEGGPALAELKADLAAIQSQITESEKEDARYTGGLTKALTASTIAILRQTEAILEQKIVSLKAGARPVIVSAAASPTLAEVEQQIATNESKIKQQEVEAARYIGGLTRALSLATLETLRQTHAMLEQRRVSLKYAF